MSRPLPTIVTPDIKLGKNDTLMLTIPCGHLPSWKAQQRVDHILNMMQTQLANTNIFAIASRSSGPVRLTKITQEV